MKALELLLIEDEPADVRLTRHGLQRCGLPTHLHVCRDGEEALAFLRREARHAGAPRPDLVLLDLNLPTISGFEVLAQLKSDPALRPIPVIALTTSAAPSDVTRAYQGHVNAYMTKPIDFDQFVALIQGLSQYWFTLCRLPPVTKGRRG